MKSIIYLQKAPHITNPPKQGLKQNGSPANLFLKRGILTRGNRLD